MKISDTKRDEIVSKLQQDIDAANAYYEETVEPKIIERYQIYNADKSFYAKMFPKLSKRCELVSTDVQDTIESTMPSMMKTFFGSTDVVTIQGVDGTDQDDSRAEKMQELINYQLEKNKFFMTFYQWAKDALITNAGIIKVDWDREYKPTQQTIMLDADAYAQYRPQAEQAGIKVLDVQPTMGGFQVTIEQQKMSKNQPRIMNVLASEFRFSPDANTLDDADFVAHRKIVSLDYLRKQQESGLYSHVEDLTERSTDPHYTTLDEQINDDIDETPNTTDSGRRKVELYECYVNINMSDNPDAKLTPMIITVSNGIILRMEENTYERNPFFILCPRMDPHKIWPDTGFVDLIAQLQHSKTAILRQMIYNIALGNDSQKAVNPSMLVDINDLLEGRSVIRVSGNVTDAIQNIPAAPLQSWTFDMLNYIDEQRENRTGITKYNQGMDSDSLNKMLDINTPVPMADGSYKILKDIVDGDIIVGRSGKPTKVKKAHIIHYPERAYDITFKSGETICAGGEHLWTVITQHGVKQVMDTDSIYKYMKNTKATLYIPTVGKVDFTGNDELPLDPYVLGAYLGNGHKHSCRITELDYEVMEYISEWAEKHESYIIKCKEQNAGRATTYAINGKLWKILHDLKIVKKYPSEEAEKYIPEAYFHASYEDRLNLMRGLMDTDGCYHSGALSIFTQKNGRLLKDFIRLVNTFGWRAHTHEVFPPQCKKDCKYFQVTISSTDNPFRLSRKANKWKMKKRCNGKQAIVSIKSASMRLMRCLTVDADDGLFCVGKHFTVTHNTATGINIITQQANQRLELIARIFAETGMSDLFRFLIKLNQLFINEETVVRLTNGPMQIDPTDLDGEFDLVVNAGMGAGAKQQNVQNMQILQGLMTQMYQLGFVGPEQAYNFAKRYIEEIGFKNTDDYLMNPQQAQQQKSQNEQKQDSMSESMRAAITDAPWQVQMQWWAKQGFQVTPDMFTEKVASDALRTAVDAHAKADATRGSMNGAGAGIGAQTAGAGRPIGKEMSGIPQTDTGRYQSGNTQQAGTSGTSHSTAGQSSGLPGGYSGMPQG